MKSPLARFIAAACFALLLAAPPSSFSRTLQVFERQDVQVMAEASMKGAAVEALDLYPGVKEDLERKLGLKVAFVPTVVLIKDSRTFRDMAGSDLVVAFAVPEEKIMVIDYSRMSLSPFTLGVTMKHELCHLLLHQYLKGGRIPRWFEEGIAQWVSEGIGEIIMDYQKPRLNEAVLAGRIIPMRALSEFFPADREALTLAYEQSRSIVSYMVERYGLESILNILEAVREGNIWEEAVWGALGISLLDLEGGWRNHLKKRMTWFTYLAGHLYQILFFLAAVALTIGFVRAYRRKRAYMEQEEDHERENP